MNSELEKQKRLPDLYGISYSPWTEKARWGLDLLGMPYRYREHTVMLDEVFLAFKMKMPITQLTVPAFKDGGVRLCNSIDIVKYASDLKSGEATVAGVTVGGVVYPGTNANADSGVCLFPEGEFAEIKHFNALSEMILDAERALVMHAVLADRQAQADSLPEYIPHSMRKHMTGLSRLGIRFLDEAFQVNRKTAKQYHDYLFQGLVSLRSALRKKRGDYLLGELSYADVCLAVALQGVLPVADEFIRLKPSIRQAWTRPEFAVEFRDLIEWRDQLYKTVRFKPGIVS